MLARRINSIRWPQSSVPLLRSRHLLVKVAAPFSEGSAIAQAAAPQAPSHGALPPASAASSVDLSQNVVHLQHTGHSTPLSLSQPPSTRGYLSHRPISGPRQAPQPRPNLVEVLVDPKGGHQRCSPWSQTRAIRSPLSSLGLTRFVRERNLCRYCYVASMPGKSEHTQGWGEEHTPACSYSTHAPTVRPGTAAPPGTHTGANMLATRGSLQIAGAASAAAPQRTVCSDKMCVCVFACACACCAIGSPSALTPPAQWGDEGARTRL